jgi:MFS family permease
MNLLDRGLMTLALQSVKEDLRLTDTQLGFLTGIAFALFYAVMGLPIARWADRADRVNVASIAIGVWSLTVMASLWVTNFNQLVLARIAAAVGEAGCKPPTYSLVGDYFPEASERTRAMAIYLTGSPIAALVSFVLGGWLSERYGWRATFFLMGIPGLILAVIFKLTIKDPRSIARDGRFGRPTATPMKVVLTVLWRTRALRHLCMALILIYALGSGLSSWFGAFLARSHAMGMREAGLWLGLILSLGGTAGILAGGYLSTSRFAGGDRNQMRLSSLSAVLLVPSYAAFLLLPQKIPALLALIATVVCIFFSQGPAYALMQRLVPDRMRATTMGVVMLLVNLIGTGLGPQLVGMMSDSLRPWLGDSSLRWAMFAISWVALWAAYHFHRSAQTVEEDLAMSQPLSLQLSKVE